MSSKTPLVIFTPSGKRGQFPAGTPVLTAARQLGVDIDSVCGGRGRCAKCQCEPAYGDFPMQGLSVASDALSEINEVEERVARVKGLKDGRRLGCQATIQTDIVIDIPAEAQVHRQVVRKAASDRRIEMDPATRLLTVRVAEPDMHVPTGDLERLATAFEELHGIAGGSAPLTVLRRLQPALRKGGWQVTCALYQPTDGAAPVVLDLWQGTWEGAIYGLASHGKLAGGFKPRNRSRVYKNLYLTGGSANPGPGVPMVLMSGATAARSVLEDHAVPTNDEWLSVRENNSSPATAGA